MEGNKNSSKLSINENSSSNKCAQVMKTDSHVDDETDEEDEGCDSYWNYTSDFLIYHIFQYLTAKELLVVGLTCKSWLRVSYDDRLWKELFYKDFKIDTSIGIAPNKTSWMLEYKRLIHNIPIIETEILKEHTNQVLHVSFSHDGKHFSTCSKDGYVMVWGSSSPATVKYFRDMKAYSWKYTQFSQFNQADTFLLVSGVHFGSPYSTSGEIAVFNLQDDFQLQCRIVNKPYDIFGTWYSNNYLLSGDLRWLAHLVSSSILWLNKASQEAESEHVPIVKKLFKIYNRSASSVRSILIANCENLEFPENKGSEDTNDNTKMDGGNRSSHNDFNSDSSESPPEVLLPVSSRLQCTSLEGAFLNWRRLGNEMTNACPFQYNSDYRVAETSKEQADESPSPTENVSEPEEEEEEDQEEGGGGAVTDSDSISSKHSSDGRSVSDWNDDELAQQPTKLLIFTTGSKTYTPHQIGLKLIKPVSFPQRMDPGPSIQERLAERERVKERMKSESPSDGPNWLVYEEVADRFDKVDHLIDMDGHIIGMGLSPDHRFLYVNTRPWPRGHIIRNPLEPPPIAQEIDIHVIDLTTLKRVGTMLRSHKAYTPNYECFFIFLDVSNEYVASGAEDKHGYLWDRHYGICLAKYPHKDVVNSVAFNPKDPEMIITVSDDCTIKVWRSRSMVDKLGLESKNGKSHPRGIELTREHFKQRLQHTCYRNDLFYPHLFQLPEDPKVL